MELIIFLLFAAFFIWKVLGKKNPELKSKIKTKAKKKYGKIKSKVKSRLKKKK